jgi:hypothetical protein
VHKSTVSGTRVKTMRTQYTEKATRWATVTPMVFDYVPKNKPGKDTDAIIRKSCQPIGLPAPVVAEVGPVSPFRGVSSAIRAVGNWMVPSKVASKG